MRRERGSSKQVHKTILRNFAVKRSRNILKKAEGKYEVQEVIFSIFKIEGTIAYLSTDENY